MALKTKGKNEEKSLTKTNAIVSNYESTIRELINNARASGNIASKPIAINGALRINILAFKDGSIMFSIAKLSQRKAVILTLDDMLFLKQLFNEKSEQLELLLTIAGKFVKPRTQQNDEDTIL